MYHSVGPDTNAEFIYPKNRMSPTLFDQQMAFLSRYRRVVPLSQVIEQLELGVSPLAGTVCITFDDGYLDNLTTAAPILEKYRLPATLYLATGYVERGEAQWADDLYCLIKYRATDKLHIPSLWPGAVALSSDKSRPANLQLLHVCLLEASREARKDLLMAMLSQLKPCYRSLTLPLYWAVIRVLLRLNPSFK